MLLEVGWLGNTVALLPPKTRPGESSTKYQARTGRAISPEELIEQFTVRQQVLREREAQAEKRARQTRRLINRLRWVEHKKAAKKHKTKHRIVA